MSTRNWQAVPFNSSLMQVALETAADVIKEADGGDPESETGWRSDELLDAWRGILELHSRIRIPA